jgi:hypothetical protein
MASRGDTEVVIRLSSRRSLQAMFPLMIIAIGVAVLLLGKRLAVLGAAVGALLGVALLRLFNVPSTDLLLSLLIPGLLAVIGFFVAGFAKGIVNIVLLVLGAVGGAAIVLAFLGLFNMGSGLLDVILALAGGTVGLILIRRYKEWGMIILAALIGALLVTRGLTYLLPSLQGAVGTLLVIVLAGGSFIYQGGFLKGRKAAAQSAAASSATPAAPAKTAPPPPPPPAAK